MLIGTGTSFVNNSNVFNVQVGVTWNFEVTTVEREKAPLCAVYSIIMQ